MANVEGSGPRWQKTGTIAWASVFVGLCGLPYLRWWANPSLFDDDFLRVGSLRRSTLAEALFRPFNEHMAPLFEVVSWLAWIGSGRSILAIPLAFQAASFLAVALTVGLLATLIRLELGSRTAAMIGVAFFCLSAVSAETVLWYSASSFQWAASATLGAWLAARMATTSSSTRGRMGWLATSAIASMMAPAFSAIGIMAGPLAAIRVVSSVDWHVSIGRRARWSVVPVFGTVAYLVLCQGFRYGELVTSSVRRSFEPSAAAWATLRAPSAVLLPGLLGLPEQSTRISGVVLASESLVGLGFTLAWASRSRHRPMIVGGLAMIVGGYLCTYATRARPGDLWVFSIQRYHLFPQLGLICLIVSASVGRLRKHDANPGCDWLASACLAGLLALVQYPRMLAASEQCFRYPDQPRALEATQKLERICEREGITLAQIMTALEPIQTRWYPRPWPFNPLANLLPTGPIGPKLDDSVVRSTLIAALSPLDREALFGGMEATRYRSSPATWADSGPLADPPRVQPTRSPSPLEFVVGPEADDARALSLRGFRTSRSMEIWWAGRDEDWSPYRSARWEPDRAHENEDSAVPLDRLPHWRRGEVRRLRVVLREPKPMAVGVPQFLR